MGREERLEELTAPPAVPFRRRWEKDTRYYEAHVETDLWGCWVLTRIWGRRGTKLGHVRRTPCESYVEALDQLATVAKQREKRGYAPACTGHQRP
jgi:predicted DNA-binding WGR domain protein